MNIADKLVADWKNKGAFVKVKNQQLFVIDTKENSKPVLVILHGYPSSSFDFYKILYQLKQYFIVIIHDHLGFGLSDKPLNYSYSLKEQADYAIALWQQLSIRKAHLLAHNYGTSVATEILARRALKELPITIETVSLTNGSVHIEMAQLRLIQKMLRNKFTGPIVAKLGSEFIYVQQMKRLWYKRSEVNEEELKALWQMGSQGNGRKVLPKITQYLNERYLYWDRWIGALKSLDIPTHIIWAKNDPVSVLKIGETLAAEIPSAKLSIIDQCGHYPMLEKSDNFANMFLMFIKDYANV